MVMKRWADACIEALSPEADVGFLYSEISDSAEVIAARLGYNKLEKSVLASLFAAFSTLALVINRDNLDAVEINCCSNGAIGGYFVRVTSKGEICGYLHNRISEELIKKFQDREGAEFFRYIYGNIATANIFRYDSKGEKADAFFIGSGSPWPDAVLKNCIQKYMKLKAETVVDFNDSNNSNFSHTIVIFNLNRFGENPTYDRIINGESIAKIQELFSLCPSLSAFRVELNLLDLMSGPNLTIQPGCTCSEADVKKQYEKVSDVEFKQLAKLVERTATHEIYRYEFRCHCCGQLYTLERSYPIEQA